MVQLIARHSFTYGGKHVAAGGEFSATERDAAILCAIKRAERAAVPAVEASPVKRKRGRPRKVLAETPQPEPEELPAEDDEPEPPIEDEQAPASSPSGRKTGTLHAKKKRRGTYKRRDMRAE
jgi:hypothetical protein